jgi:hypothetical protein
MHARLAVHFGGAGLEDQDVPAILQSGDVGALHAVQ